MGHHFAVITHQHKTSKIIIKDKSKKSGKSSKKNEAPRDRNKLRKERAFLFFIAHNPHYLQNKKNFFPRKRMKIVR